jgi:DNA-binding GntR family transcriptional regulator
VSVDLITNQQLLVRFPNLSNNDVIVPGTTRLAFEIEINSTDKNSTLYQNVGRTIIKKTTIRISGNEVMSIDDSDIYHCYVDLWKSPTERMNMAGYLKRSGIHLKQE